LGLGLGLGAAKEHLAELRRYLYRHWSSNFMKHLCCW